MAGNKAMRRALETNDVIRVNASVPLIRDTTEMITPEIARAMLERNKHNRPINWAKVEAYADVMARGEWKLHSQGIVFDQHGNLLTGQQRLWAVIYSDKNVYMRVSRGNPADTAKLLDRGRPQTSRDLATRDTERKHSPTEASIARAILAMRGNLRPTVDQLAEAIISNAEKASIVLHETKGTKKTKSILMALAAICGTLDLPTAKVKALEIEDFAARIESALMPNSATQCWGRGAAFGFAMQRASNIIQEK